MGCSRSLGSRCWGWGWAILGVVLRCETPSLGHTHPCVRNTVVGLYSPSCSNPRCWVRSTAVGLHSPSLGSARCRWAAFAVLGFSPSSLCLRPHPSLLPCPVTLIPISSPSSQSPHPPLINLTFTLASTPSPSSQRYPPCLHPILVSIFTEDFTIDPHCDRCRRSSSILLLVNYRRRFD